MMGKPDALSIRLDHSIGLDDNSNVTLLFAIYVLEGIELVRKEMEILQDICKGNWEGDQENSIS